jgi:excisionase family DNA binding protein
MRVGKAGGGEWLRLGEAAAVLGVSLNTLRRWSDTGRLTSYRSPGGHRRYRRSHIEALLQEQSPAPGQVQAEDMGVAPARYEHDVSPLSALARVAADGLDVTSCTFFLATGGGALRFLAEYARGVQRPHRSGGSTITPAQAPCAAEVLRTSRRVIVADLTATNLFTPAETEVCRSTGDTAVLALPLARGERVLGVMQLAARHTPRTFTGADIAFAEFVAGQAVHLIGDGDAPAAPASVVAQVTASFAAPPRGRPPTTAGETPRPAHRDGLDRQPGSPAKTPDREQLTRRLLSDLATGPDVTRCSVYALRDGSAVLMASSSDAAPPARRWTLADDPAAQRAVSERKLIAVRTSGTLLAPLVFNDAVIGLLEAGCSTADRLGSCRLPVQTAAEVLATIIGCGDLLVRLERQNADLELIVQAGLDDIAKLNTDDVLHAVAERLSQTTASPVVDIFAVESDVMRSLVSYDGGTFDAARVGVVVPLRRYPCVHRAVDTGEITITASLDDPELTDEGRYSLEKWGYQAQLSLPLVSAGRVVGLVQMSDYVPRDFRPDLELVRGLGQVAAHALRNASAFEQAERRHRALGELVDLAELTANVRDGGDLLRIAAERLRDAIDAANCDIFTTCAEGFRCVASYDRSGHNDRVIGSLFDTRSYPTAAAAVTNRQILVIAHPDDAQLSADERRTYRELGFASEVCIPLVVDGDLFGLIDLYDTRERDYTKHLAFFESAGRILARACENARRVGQLEHQVRLLGEIVDLAAIAAQAHQPADALRLIAERTRAIAGSTACDIYALQGDRLRCLVSVRRQGQDESASRGCIEAGDSSAAAAAVRSGQSLVATTLDDPRFSDRDRGELRAHGYQSALYLPVLLEDRGIGLIVVLDETVRDFAELTMCGASIGRIATRAVQEAVRDVFS